MNFPPSSVNLIIVINYVKVNYLQNVSSVLDLTNNVDVLHYSESI